MLAALGALVAAVVTTLLYLVLTEEMDYSSVQRRQLDAWAASVAVLCMGLILYGNASVSRSVEQSPSVPPVPQEAPPVEDAPWEGPRRAATVEPSAETEEAPVVIAEAQSVVPEEAPAEEARPEPATADEPLPAEPSPGDEAPESVFPKPGFNDQPTQVPPTRTPSATSTTAPSPSPTLVARVAFKTATPSPSPTEPPVEPTVVAMITPTPHCGDPADIALKVGELKTEVERAGSDVLVHFSFDVRNDSPFPVTLVDFTVAARAQNPWRERFGHIGLSDVRVEPGAVFPVRDSLVIERFPAPNERVQMCANFVPKTCGASRPENGVDGRCWTEIPSLFFETELTSP